MEWMMRDDNARCYEKRRASWICRWHVEKYSESNKGLLPLLWRFPRGHLNLLPVRLRAKTSVKACARAACVAGLSAEGGNVTIE